MARGWVVWLLVVGCTQSGSTGSSASPAAASISVASTAPGAGKMALGAARLTLVVVGAVDPKELAGAGTRFKGAEGRTVESKALSADDKKALLEDAKGVGEAVAAATWASLEAAKGATAVTLRWRPDDAWGLTAAYAVAAQMATWPGVWVFASDVDRLLDDKSLATLVADAARKPPRAPLHFVNQLFPEDDGSLTVETAGTERFGLRAVRLEHIPRSSARPVGRLVNLLAQRWVEGLRPAADGTLTLAIADIVHPEARKVAQADLLPSGKGRLRVACSVVAAGPEQVVELDFPEEPGKSLDERREQAIDQLFGSTDSAQDVTHSAALLEVSRKSRERLIRELKPRVQRGLPAGELLLVKAPFKCQGGTEWMWVEVQTWKGTTLAGPLQSSPECATGLHAGQRVEVAEDDLFDYMDKFLDGSFVGNDTGKVLQPDFFEELDGGRRRVKE